MRETIRDKERLLHIQNAIDVLMARKDTHTLGDVMSDPIIFYGYVKHIEIIGEAVYMLTKEYRSSHNEVNWDDIERMRHVLVHGYYKIRPDQLWETVQTDIPELKPIIDHLVDDYDNEKNNEL